MAFPDHMFMVRATVEADREAEFNRWYDTEHVPDVFRLLPGVIDAARYKVGLGDGSHQYMAVYAFDTAANLQAAMAGDGIKALVKLYDEAIGSFSTRNRTTYAKIFAAKASS